MISACSCLTKKSAEEPSNWESSSAVFVYRVWVFSVVFFSSAKNVLRFSVPEPVPASHSVPCGSKDPTTFPAKAVSVCPVYSIQNFSVNGDGYHLPRNELSAGLKRLFRCHLQAAAAGHLHAEDGHALDVVAATLGTQNYARLRFGIGNDFPKGGQIDFVLGHFDEESMKLMPERLE